MSLPSHASRALFNLLALAIVLALALALLVAPAGAALAADAAAGDAAAASDPSTERVDPSPGDGPADAAPAGPALQVEPTAPAEMSSAEAFVSLLAEDPVVVQRVGPEDLTGNSIYWEVRAGNALVGGAEFRIERRSNTGNMGGSWQNAVTVTDCQTAPAPCPAGSVDRDPEAGEFQVQSVNGAVAIDRRYLVTRLTPPPFYSFTTPTTWQASAGRTAGVADLGDFDLTSASAQIVVRVGGDRTSGNVAPLEGVSLRLRVGSGANNQGVGSIVAEPWGVCVSNAAGLCTFTVPTTGDYQSERFWVEGLAAPTGWRHNEQLRTGSSSASGTEATDYRFLTPPVATGRVYTSGTDFMTLNSGGDRLDSHGIWQLSRDNRPLAQACGLDIAFVMDFSGSVGGQVDNLVTAAANVVNAVRGTPSRASFYSFSGDSRAPQTNLPNIPTLQSVNGNAEAAAFIGSFATPSGGGYSSRITANGGTNWDAALRRVAAANSGANLADVIIVLTDGNPTNALNLAGNTVTGNGSRNEFREIEAGIYTANHLRNQGSRVVAIGVGAGVSDANTSLNLSAISGTVQYNGSNATTADFFKTTDYQAAAEAMEQLARGACDSTITVTKRVIPAGGGVADSQPAGGWEFTASSRTTGLTVPAPTSKTTPATVPTTGAVNFPLEFTGGLQAGSVRVVETPQTGYTLEQISGANAVCTRRVGTTDQPVTVSNVQGAPGFEVSVPSNGSVSCIVYNRELPRLATLEVDKLWIINGGEAIADGTQPPWLRAVLGLTGTGQPTQQWGTVYPGEPAYTVGQTVQVSETVDPIPAWLPGCAITSRIVTDANGESPGTSIATSPYTHTLVAGANHVTVTNSVTCTTNLTLAKSVTNGGALPTDWTLTAAGTGGPFTGVTGAEAITSATITADATYTLSETGGSAVYVQDGEWACVPVGANGSPVTGSGWTDPADAEVAVPLGMHAKCTVTNATAQLTLLKTIEGGGVLTPSMFDLTATPAALDGLGTTTVAGADEAGMSNTFFVRPGHDYVLSEASDSVSLAYLGLRLEKRVNGTWVTVDDPAAAITVAVGGHETYRFVNAAPQPLALPLTGGIGADAYWLGGAAMLLLALLAAATVFTRSRMRPVTTGGRHA